MSMASYRLPLLPVLPPVEMAGVLDADARPNRCGFARHTVIAPGTPPESFAPPAARGVFGRHKRQFVRLFECSVKPSGPNGRANQSIDTDRPRAGHLPTGGRGRPAGGAVQRERHDVRDPRDV